MDNIYDPDKLQSEAVQKKLMLDTAVDVQAILQILVSKEITTKEEVDKIRNIVKSQPKYKLAYDYINGIQTASETWKNDPQAYLKELLKAKMDGKVK